VVVRVGKEGSDRILDTFFIRDKCLEKFQEFELIYFLENNKNIFQLIFADEIIFQGINGGRKDKFGRKKESS